VANEENRFFFRQGVAIINFIIIFVRIKIKCSINLNLETMNKAELIDAIAKEAKLSKVDSGRALDATITAISKSLKKGEGVILVGFGSFSIAKRAARTGRNPQTGKPIKIAAKKVAKFKPGAALAKSVK